MATLKGYEAFLNDLEKAATYYLNVKNAYATGAKYINFKNELGIFDAKDVPNILTKLYETRYHPILEFIALRNGFTNVANIETQDTFNIDGKESLDPIIFLKYQATSTINICSFNSTNLSNIKYNKIPNVATKTLLISELVITDLYQIDNDYIEILELLAVQGANYILLNTPKLQKLYTNNSNLPLFLKDIKTMDLISITGGNIKNLSSIKNIDTISLSSIEVNYDDLVINSVVSYICFNVQHKNFNYAVIKNVYNLIFENCSFTGNTNFNITSSTVNYINLISVTGIYKTYVNAPNLKRFYQIGNAADYINYDLIEAKFENCIEMTEVSLYYNKLEKIDIINCPNIQYVDLNNNQLQQITGLENLTKLNYFSVYQANVDKTLMTYIVDALYSIRKKLASNQCKIYLNANPSTASVCGNSRVGGVDAGNGAYKFATFSGGTLSDKLTEMSQMCIAINIGV